MKLSVHGWMAALAVAGIASAVGCGNGSSTTTGTSSTGSGGGATGSGGGTTSTTGTGTGGSAPLGPFTSKGASSYEAQTSLAADTKGGVVATWIAFFADNTSAIGYAVSRDGGGTWTAPAYVHSPGGRLAGNPVVAVDGQGRFSLVWLGFPAVPTSPDEHIYLSRLDNATETFGAPVVASDDGTSTMRDFDKPSLTVDANDNLLITWADFTGSSMNVPASLTFARSTDGVTFDRSTIVNDATFGNLAYLCVDASAGPSAPLYVVHLGAGGTLTLRKSTDQGKTWAPLTVPATSVVFQGPTCVSHGAELWVGYGSGTALFSGAQNAPADAVDVVHSANGGAAWDAPVVVSNGGAGVQYLFPQLVRAPAGPLEVVYYQGTVAGTASLVLRSSPDGATWAGSAVAMPGNFTIDRTIASWLGDYLGVASPAAAALSSYTDNSAGKAHIGFTKVAVP
jgi:hypothetical protein